MAGSDGLTPEIFKDDGLDLAKIWELKVIRSYWFRSLIVPVYKKEQKSPYDSHKEIRFISIISKVLASIILRHLTVAHEGQTRGD